MISMNVCSITVYNLNKLVVFSNFSAKEAANEDDLSDDSHPSVQLNSVEEFYKGIVMISELRKTQNFGSTDIYLDSS